MHQGHRLSSLGTRAFVVTILLGGIATEQGWAEPPAGMQLGPKVTTEHKVKSVVGPSVQIDDAGSLSLVWMEENKEVRSVMYARSAEPGRPMGAPVRINRAEDIPYWRQEAPALVAQGDEELRLSRSSDGGRTFQPSIVVNDDPGVIQHTFDALHRDADGRLHLSWIDGREGKKEPGTYVARSLDRGATITKNLKVDEGTCVCCRTAVTSGPDGMVYVAWRKIFEGNVRDRPARIGPPPWEWTARDDCMSSGIRKGPTKFPRSISPFPMTGARRSRRSSS
ncbi:MAG: exo-alpha-sialidase [Nitrospira sp. NTP1]|nr:exo-alpha-sialidase [Nitrospira sp. NTP1]